VRRLLLIVAALGVLIVLCTPPPAALLPPPPAAIAEPVRGVVHVHTRRSDGGGTVEQVARAAERAGLNFVVLTDHGDATRPPNAPEYYGGVLIIDAAEISTQGGHVIALHAGRAPYPLAGEARDVVEDINRLGGLAIASHPTSHKGELRWTDWNVPIHALEYLNADSEWRDEPFWRVARALFAYPVRPVETLALFFDRPQEALRRWDELLATRRVAALAAADAHGRIGLRAQEPYRGRLALPLPGYEPVFRAASVALPDARLTRDAAADARLVVERIVAGRTFSSVDAIAARPRFAFTATSGQYRASAGEALALDGPVRIDVAVQAPAGAEIVLLRDGMRRASSNGAALRHEAEPTPAVYRVEVLLPGAPGEPPVPWIVSNPIYVGRSIPMEIPPHAPRPASARADLYVDGPAVDWTVEHSAESDGAVDVVNAVTGTQVLLRYALSGSASSHPFAALVAPAGPIAGYDRLTFRAQADKPMRVSVQLRAPGSDNAGERWHRSVYVDTAPREISVRFDDMRPRGPTTAPQPTLDAIRWVLFVVDTVNTPIGTAGQLFVDDVRYER
jgi:hypothetical protein